MRETRDLSLFLLLLLLSGISDARKEKREIPETVGGCNRFYAGKVTFKNVFRGVNKTKQRRYEYNKI